MDKNTLASATKTGDPAAHCILIARGFLKRATKEENGRTSNLIVSLVFTAFALEGALKRIGERVETKRWKDIEGLGFKKKINYLCLGILGAADWGQRPLLNIQKVIKFRNLLAHAKEDKKSITNQSISSPEELDDALMLEFEKHLKVPFAKQALKDVEDLAVQLWNKGNCGQVPNDHYGDVGIDSGPFGTLGTSQMTTWQELEGDSK